MPLQSGSSRAAIGANIRREEEAGKPKDQAIAVALSKAGKSTEEGRRARLAEAAAKLRKQMFGR